MTKDMIFSQKYEELERKFCAQVLADFDCGNGWSELLRNISPKGPVDFVLIAREPSLGGRKLREEEKKIRPATWKEIENNPDWNFSRSIEDFILHFSIRKYLCKDTEEYYVTDLSKGAMYVEDARVKPRQRYERWYSLLKEELQLVGKPGNTRIIAVGSDAQNFLSRKGLCESIESILHYSAAAAGHRNRRIQPWRTCFPKFRQTVSMSDIEETAKAVWKQIGYSEDSIASKVKQLQSGSGLTKSRQKLMFYYKNRFERLKTSDSILLRVE